MTVFNIYSTNVGKCRTISDAMAKGTGFPIVPPAPLRHGGVIMYGCLRGMLPTLTEARGERRVWVYCDNAYFGRDVYFRVTKNAYQHDGMGTAAPDRWDRLGRRIKPWRKGGAHVLVCPPEPLATELFGVEPTWLEKVLAQLAKHTDREIRVRHRVGSVVSSGRSLAEDLSGAWAVVVWTSNVAVDALLAGVPVFCTHPCASYRMGTPDLSQIEAPVMPDDRERWAHVLAANQWTLDEMRSGQCWRELNAR